MELDKNTRKFLKALKNKDLNDAQIVSLLGSPSFSAKMEKAKISRNPLKQYV